MKPTFHKLRVKKIVSETSAAYSIYLTKPAGDLWDFKPGQYLTIEVTIAGKRHRRAFSLASMPYEADMVITIKRIPEGLVSQYLWDYLSVGDALNVIPPMGGFVVPIDPQHQRHYILIGAGSGITPLISMLKTVLHKEPLSRVTLWYGNRNEEQIIFREQLSTLKATFPERLTLIHVLSKPCKDWNGLRGRLDKDQIYELISELFMVDTYAKRYYLCGPEGMMLAAQEAMAKHAIDPRFVHQEHYHVPVDKLIENIQESTSDKTPQSASSVAIFESVIDLTLDGKQYQLKGSSDKALLDTALQADLAVPYTCKGGICTTCKAILKAGEVDMKVDLGLSEGEKKMGYILTCQAYPLTEAVSVSYDEEEIS